MIMVISQGQDVAHCTAFCPRSEDKPTMTFELDIKSVGLKLIPFAKTFTLYFALFIPSEEASFFAAFIKCLPIISLNLFIFLHGFSTGDDYFFRKCIFRGLLFSCLGDIFLVWPHLFVPGMISFGIAHLFYIKAFGFKPLKPVSGFILYTFAALMSYILLPGLNGVLVYGVPIYSFILATMTWRAIARVPDLKNGIRNWNRLLTGVGGISWMFSDMFLGLHHFYKPLPFSQVLIMVTYYVGQLGITLSVLERQEKEKK